MNKHNGMAVIKMVL